MPEVSATFRGGHVERIDISYTEASEAFETLHERTTLNPNLDDALDDRKVLGRNCKEVIDALTIYPREATERLLDWLKQMRKKAEESNDHEAYFIVLGLEN